MSTEEATTINGTCSAMGRPFEVADKYGNSYEFNPFPSDGFVKRLQNGTVEFHAVFQQKGVGKPAAPKKKQGRPF